MKKINLIFGTLLLLLSSCVGNNNNKSRNTNEISNISSSSSIFDDLSNYDGKSLTYQLISDNGEVVEDSQAIILAKDIMESKINLLGISQTKIYVENNYIKLATNINDDEIINLVNRLMIANLDISFRDIKGTLLASEDEMLDKNAPITMYGTDYLNISLNLSSSGVSIFDNQIINNVGIDKELVIWLGYSELDNYLEYTNVLPIISQGGLDSLTAYQRMVYNYYNCKVLTTSLITEDLVNLGGLSGLGQNQIFLKSDFDIKRANNLSNLILLDNLGFSLKLVENNS